MTQVPWLLLIPRLPAMFGTETLATVMSSTAMKFAAASTMAAIQSIDPFSGPSNVVPDMCLPPEIACCSAARARIDRRGHRQADLQRTRGQLRRIQLDAHRHALHDLDPVAGRVLRRDRRERRACAASEAGHGAVIGHRAAVQIGLHLDRLADAHAP